MLSDDFSKELLLKEEEFLKKNKDITEKVNIVFNQVETVVKKGHEEINRPKSSPIIEIKEKKEKSSARAKNIKENELQEVFLGLGPNANEETHGTEAATRFLKAKTLVLQQELEKLHTEKKDRDLAYQNTIEISKNLEKENAKLKKQLKDNNNITDKLRVQNQDLQKKCLDFENQLHKLKREVESTTKNFRISDQDAHQKDLRLNRVLEELEKSKMQFSLKEAQYKETIETGKKTADELFAENKRLQKQKQDLLCGFKKQVQLIDILKRQKMHLEAVKLLQLTEQEFTKALQID